MENFIQINPADNCAVALTDLAAGSVACGVTLRENIGRGHKFALRPIASGDKVIKYGMPIGSAVCAIAPGEKIHVHNLRTLLAGELVYTYSPESRQTTPAVCTQTFRGYRRADGRVGIRNNIWIIPTVGCVNKLAENLAENFNRRHGAKAATRALALPHPYGCSQLGADHELTRQTLINLAMHPNAGGVLIIGLGCENNTLEQFKAHMPPYDPARVKFMVAQDAGDEFACGISLLDELATSVATDVRSDIPLSELVVGLKCGGSDGLSGITANSLVGRFSDLLAAQGGTSILSEVPEMFGAETLLMNRCVDKNVFSKCVDMVNDFKNYFNRYGQTIYENPSPGNKDGGISTLEDKSLGCTQKAGSSQVYDVLHAGDRVTKHGLNLLTGPGNDMVATTMLTSAGAHLVLFTTGRGTPFGGVVPTLKIASNSVLAANKKSWIDFDAGRLLQGESPEDLSAELFRLVVAVAEGASTARNEENGYEEIAIFKDGVTL